MGFSFSSRGDWSKTHDWMVKMTSGRVYDQLARYGIRGVDALSNATPMDSGLTADSWRYEIKKERNTWSLIWCNDNIVDGRPVAILLQYDHATGNGGWVEGTDYINPALKPIFDQITKDFWRVVTA